MVAVPSSVRKLAKALCADLAQEQEQKQDRCSATERETPSSERGEAGTSPAVSGGGGKQLATLRALPAIHGGHVVHELPDGGFLVCWRGISRDCADSEALEAHARRVGALR